MIAHFTGKTLPHLVCETLHAAGARRRRRRREDNERLVRNLGWAREQVLQHTNTRYRKTELAGLKSMDGVPLLLPGLPGCVIQLHYGLAIQVVSETRLN